MASLGYSDSPREKRNGSPFGVPAGDAARRGHAVSLPNMAGRGILSTARARTTLAGAGRADCFVLSANSEMGTRKDFESSREPLREQVDSNQRKVD